jgi:predicted PurR-regulated permease PerM
MFFVLGSVGLTVAALYLGRHIFVPLALAILLTLLLSPVVSRLERKGLKRIPAVLFVAGIAFVLIGLSGWAVEAQVTSLLADLPQHKANIRAKLAQLRGTTKPGTLGSFQDFVDEIDTAGIPEQQNKVPVVRVEPAKPSLLAQLQPVAAQVLGVVSAVLTVVFLVVMLLLYREDTRNRLIRLAGRGRLTLTTRALDEAAKRIGGYLLGHAAVNAVFGTAVALGLLAIGVPYPVLWGMLAAAFRFIPSVGIWLVVPLPAALAFSTNTGFLPPVLVLGLFLVLDLLMSNVVEPRICGRSVGLAPVPLLLAVTFWTGLWGIIGLVLATPVTVCLAVLGRHVRQLRFLAVVLGQEAALRPSARYYQRLLARDRYEAEEVVKEYVTSHSVEDLFDRVLIPALVLVRRGRKAGELKAEDEEFIIRETQEIVRQTAASKATFTNHPDQPVADSPVVLGIPAMDAVDAVALLMLRCLAQPGGLEVLGPNEVADREISPVETATPPVILIAAVGPGGLTEARFLCRRIRAQHPGAKIVVGRWGKRRDPKKARARLLSAGADRVAATLRETHAQLTKLATQHSPTPAPDVSAPVG